MCITGEAGGFRDHFGDENKKEKKTGSNFATLQRRDVSTSGRHLGFCLTIIKSKGDLISRSSKNVRRRARKKKQQ